ncbi:MAG: phosphoribosylformylglycinamidine synthase, partial [Chitinispirillales bacterium]|nr:phosphoribosylformylglycinamidine synthase [Chitinispirillales bacterium]
MSKVRRLFVEKRGGYDIHSQQLFIDLKDNLGISGLSGVRTLNRYDIQGLTDDYYESAKDIIFAEPPVDNVYDETMTLEDGERAFAVEYLPGQYDQRADSASQCAELLTLTVRPTVAAARIIVLKGNISAKEFEKIKRYCINPVDSREASLDKPETLDISVEPPADVAVLNGFISMKEEELENIRHTLGLAMKQEDLLFCQQYFRDTEKRDPTITEIRMLDTYWSDHCRHTTFLTGINNVEIEDAPLNTPVRNALKMYEDAVEYVYGNNHNRKKSLMDIALMGMKTLRKRGLLDDLDASEEINACSIVVPAIIDGKSEEWLVMFKNETHNHPTEIEPFGGAATCLGGAIRDPLSGRSYVYQAMRVTGAGDPRKALEETLPGKLSQAKITTLAAHGYSSYGNQIGLATGLVSEVYHEGYVAKRMEIGAVVGAAPKSNVTRGVPEAGDIVVLLGGRTGRDGCGGATGSSKEHTEESIKVCSAEVQKGNPPTERKIQRLFRDSQVSRMIKRCNDFGAGGVSVAIGELAPGLEIDLDAVPKKYEGLDGTELAISESQERMAVVIAKSDLKAFEKAAHGENLETAVVAVVTESRRLKMNWRGKTIVDISRDFLDTNGTLQSTEVKVNAPSDTNNFFMKTLSSKWKDGDISGAFTETLSNINVCSQRGMVEMFDSSIGAGSVLMPFGGKFQKTPVECMAAKLPLQNGETSTGTAMSYGFDPYLSSWSPFHGAVYAV